MALLTRAHADWEEKEGARRIARLDSGRTLKKIKTHSTCKLNPCRMEAT